MGLRGQQGVVGVSVGGCSFPSGLLAEGSKAVGDRARLACKIRKAERGHLLQMLHEQTFISFKNKQNVIFLRIKSVLAHIEIY